MPLSELKLNRRGIIKSLPQMKLLDSLGLREGTTIMILSRQPLNGPLVIQLGRRSIALGRDISDHIHVDEVS